MFSYALIRKFWNVLKEDVSKLAEPVRVKLLDCGKRKGESAKALRRSNAKKSLVENVKLEENNLPLNIDEVNLDSYLSRFSSDLRPEILNKISDFNDLRNEVVDDFIDI